MPSKNSLIEEMNRKASELLYYVCNSRVYMVQKYEKVGGFDGSRKTSCRKRVGL